MPPRKTSGESPAKIVGGMSPDEFYKKLSKEDRKSVGNLEDAKIDFIPTGSWVLNYLIGDGTMTSKPGGFPRGHIVEIFGDESCGKSTVALSACRQVQEMGGLPVFLDFERTFHKLYAERLGIDTSPKKFVHIRPDHFQHGARMIQDSLQMKPWLIVVDSVSAMIPKQFLEGSVDEAGRIGLQAQLMSTTLSYFTKMIPEANTCLLFTNQLRSVIKTSMYDRGPTEESTGGRALKFYSSVRVKLQKSSVEYVTQKSKVTGKSEREPINVMVKATVVKNKVDRPLLSGPLYIRFGEGIDNITSIITLAENLGIVKKAGAIYKFSLGSETVASASGKEKFRRVLEENPQALEKLSSSLVFQEDPEAKEQYEEEGGQDKSNIDDLLDQASETFVKKDEDKD